jgi:hypothetical protein
VDPARGTVTLAFRHDALTERITLTWEQHRALAKPIAKLRSLAVLHPPPLGKAMAAWRAHTRAQRCSRARIALLAHATQAPGGCFHPHTRALAVRLRILLLPALSALQVQRIWPLSQRRPIQQPCFRHRTTCATPWRLNPICPFTPSQRWPRRTPATP